MARSGCEMATPVVAIDSLRKTYRLGGHEIVALEDLSLTIEVGELVAVMGPSGSGKSTLMNLIGCLDRPSFGTYRLDGVDVAELDADALATLRNRRIGFCFQSFNLLQRASALANVELPLVYAGVPPRQRRERAREVLGAVGLGDRVDHLPTQLSGGQQQRVAIARALVNAPALILADEPTGGLDSRTGSEIMALFGRLNAQGITIVIVTHEPEVAAYARRLIQLRDGRLIDDRRQPGAVRGVEPVAA